MLIRDTLAVHRGAGCVLAGNVQKVASDLGAQLLLGGNAARLDLITQDGDLNAYAKNYGAYIPFAGASLNLDVTALAVAAVTGALQTGDTAFAKAFLIIVHNYAAPGSGFTLSVGNDGTAAEWYDPIGIATTAVIIQPGCSHSFHSKETNGWAVGPTRKKLLLNPGANTFPVSLYIGGA